MVVDGDGAPVDGASVGVDDPVRTAEVTAWSAPEPSRPWSTTTVRLRDPSEYVTSLLPAYSVVDARRQLGPPVGI